MNVVRAWCRRLSTIRVQVFLLVGVEPGVGGGSGWRGTLLGPEESRVLRWLAGLPVGGGRGVFWASFARACTVGVGEWVGGLVV